MRKFNYALTFFAATIMGLNVATAQAQCVGENSGAHPPIVSYDTPYYGFTVGMYGAPQPPFISAEVTTLRIEPTLPDGLKFNIDTGAITGTPTEPTQGMPPFVVRAYDAHGRCGTYVVRIAVNPSPTPAVSPSPSPIPSPSATPSATPRIWPSSTPQPSPSAVKRVSWKSGLTRR